jgi:hypothetical protein
MDRVQKLRQFVEDWRIAAKIENKQLVEIKVSLVRTLEDVCEILEIDPAEIGLTQDEDSIILA